MQQAAFQNGAGKPRAWLAEVFVSYQGEGRFAGAKHLFVRFAGCNIRCRYCDTPDALVRVPSCSVSWSDGREELHSNPIAAEVLAGWVASLCEADPQIEALALTGGEPLVQHRFLAHWLGRFSPPRPCLLETNAMLAAAAADVLPHVAIVSADMKLPSNSGERPLWDEHAEFLRACRGRELYVKVPVDRTTSVEELRRAARLVRREAPHASLYIQPITSPAAQWELDRFRLAELVAIAQAEFAQTRLRPQMHKLVGLR